MEGFTAEDAESHRVFFFRETDSACHPGQSEETVLLLFA